MQLDATYTVLLPDPKSSSRTLFTTYQKPFVILGAEVTLSSLTSSVFMSTLWKNVKAMHANTAFIAVSRDAVDPFSWKEELIQTHCGHQHQQSVLLRITRRF